MQTKPQSRVISFSSGKGGVGKTTVVANVGALYAEKGFKTLLVDGDWSLGKLGITLGVKPRWNIESVLKGEVDLWDAIHPVSENLSILASPSGIVGFEELDVTQRNQLFFEFERLGSRYERILLDHSSGLQWNVLQFAAAAHQHVVVTTSEPTSYTDAYAIMKVLSKQFAVREFQLLVTCSQNRIETEQIISRFSTVVHQNLNIRLNIVDILPWEPALSECIRKQQLFVKRYPERNMTDKFEQVRESLERREIAPSHGLRFFYHQETTPLSTR